MVAILTPQLPQHGAQQHPDPRAPGSRDRSLRRTRSQPLRHPEGETELNPTSPFFTFQDFSLAGRSSFYLSKSSRPPSFSPESRRKISLELSDNIKPSYSKSLATGMKLYKPCIVKCSMVLWMSVFTIRVAREVKETQLSMLTEMA